MAALATLAQHPACLNCLSVEVKAKYKCFSTFEYIFCRNSTKNIHIFWYAVVHWAKNSVVFFIKSLNNQKEENILFFPGWNEIP